MDVFEYGNRDAKIVLIQPVDEHDLSMIEREIAAIRERTARDFRLVACKVNSWNRDLSPWKAPAVFGREDFGEGAAATLDEILSFCGDRTKTYCRSQQLFPLLTRLQEKMATKYNGSVPTKREISKGSCF